jgi:hypothetical protein
MTHTGMIAGQRSEARASKELFPEVEKDPQPGVAVHSGV